MAAGEGRRCRPLTQTRSKVMLPVGNRPFMEYVIRALAANGIEDIYVVVGYQKERVMDYFEDGIDFDVAITYIEQNGSWELLMPCSRPSSMWTRSSWW